MLQTTVMGKKKSNKTPSTVRSQIDQLLDEQTDDQLQHLLSYLKDGVKVYIAECTWCEHDQKNRLSNVPVKIITNDNVIGYGKCLTWIDETLYDSDQPLEFPDDWVVPSHEKIFSEYVSKNAQRWVDLNRDNIYCRCDSTEVLMDEGLKEYNGVVFYTKYLGTVSTLYCTADDKANNANYCIIGTRYLLRVVLRTELEALREEYKAHNTAKEALNDY